MQKDMHYYGTYAMARAAGLSPESCQTIATAAEFVDDNGEKDTIIFEDGGRLDFVPTAHHTTSIKNIDRQDQRHVWLPFHFIPGNEGKSISERLLCRKNSLISRELIEHNLSHASRPYGLHLVGIAAHVYADTFSHYGFSGVSSRWNKVDSSSFKLIGVRSEIYEYIEKKRKDFYKKYKTETGSFENFRLKLQDDDRVKNLYARIRDIFSKGIETFSGALGHGAVFTYPDRPYLKWQFDYEKPKRSSGLRDNPATFLEACEELHGMFCRLGEKRPDIQQDDGRCFDDIKDSVQQILDEQAPCEGREEAWKKAAENGELFTGKEKILAYQGEEWAGGINLLKQSQDSHDALKAPIFRDCQEFCV